MTLKGSAQMVRAAFVVSCAFASASAGRADEPNGVRFDGDRFTVEDGELKFRGVIVKPTGKGPFPAILVSHGMGGDGERFGRTKAREFVKAGYVCLSPDYAHVRGGDRKDFGASDENIRRATKCLDILESMKDVDANRLYAYGNSMGAFLTIGLIAEEPKRLAAAAITAGGVAPVEGQPAPSKARAAKIKVPILILHGSADTTVPPERSQMLEDILKNGKIPHERKLFEGVGHELHASRAREVHGMIDGWFKKHRRKDKT
jgi:dienelactone hydrolase